MFNVISRMNCVTYWLVTYTRTNRKDRPLIFMLKFLRENSQFFTTDSWKSAQRLFFDVPERSGYSLFEDLERSRHSLYECPELTQEIQKKLYEFLECSRHSIKEYLERSGSSNKEYPVCSGTSNNDLFAHFQLSIVKNCDFYPQKFQPKNEGLVLPLRSGISYKPIGNTVHLWHNIEHALWIF